MFIVLQPKSRTNPSNKFRVAEYKGWMRFINGDSQSYTFTEWRTFEEATEAANQANRV